MVLALTAAVVVVILGAALVLSARLRARSRAAVAETDASGDKLPAGADAAIWSILEAVPDPRNHLALTRDLTGEVRITGTPLDPEWRAAHPDLDPWAAAAAWDEREHLSPTAA